MHMCTEYQIHDYDISIVIWISAVRYCDILNSQAFHVRTEELQQLVKIKLTPKSFINQAMEWYFK